MSGLTRWLHVIGLLLITTGLAPTLNAQSATGPTGPEDPPVVPTLEVLTVTPIRSTEIDVRFEVGEHAAGKEFTRIDLRLSNGRFQRVGGSYGTGQHTERIVVEPMASNSEYVLALVGINGSSQSQDHTTFTTGTLSGAQVNFVETTTVRVPLDDANGVSTLAVGSGEKAVSIAFADAQGRSSQSVSVGSSPGGYDQIAFHEYDVRGKETTRYLPFVAETSNGSFQLDLVERQASFYAANAPADVTPVARPYSEVQLKDAPVDIVEEASPAGSRASTALGEVHTTRMEERVNTAADHVWTFRVVYRDEDPERTNSWISGEYDPGMLLVSRSTDANGRVSEEYTDRSGRSILKRVFENHGTTQQIEHDTYYIYDLHGRLRYILPPTGVAFLKAPDGSPRGDRELYQASGHYTRYVYDTEGREVEKHIPEEEAIYTVYDRLGRVVARQDGPLRQGKSWLFTKYDVRGREVLTGIWRHDAITTRKGLQHLVLTGELPGGTQAYTFALHEERIACSSELDPSREGAYTDTAFPRLESARVEVLTHAYYDDYITQESCALFETVHSFHEAFRADAYVTDSGEHAEPFAKSERTLGMATHSLVRVLHAGDSYIPEPDCEAASEADGHQAYVTEFTTWTESLEQTAANNSPSVVGVTEAEVQLWINDLETSVDTTILEPQEAQGFSQLQDWLVQARDVAANRGGTVYLNLNTLSQTNQQAELLEGVVHAAAVNRCGEVVAFEHLEFSGETMDELTSIDIDSLQTALAPDTAAAASARGAFDIPLRDWMVTTTYYDEDARPIQTITDGHLAERRDVVSTQYAFDGRVLQTYHNHIPLPNSTVGFREQRMRLFERYEYDHIGRQTHLWRMVYGEPEYVLAEETTYNELGQVIRRGLHSEDQGVTFAETQTYSYHPRGWMEQMASDLLTLDFYYDEANGLPNHDALYDGTITGLRWTAPTSVAPSLTGERGGAYAYAYDDLGRLTAGRFADYNPATSAFSASERYTLANVDYDPNGNITRLTRCGPGGTAHGSCGSAGAIDDLTYHYEEGHQYEVLDADGTLISWQGSRANRLIAVDDAASQTAGFSDNGSFYNQIAPNRVGDAEYWYNGNGATRRDDGKGLRHTFYAVNSLPRIAWWREAPQDPSLSGTVEWTYAATGARIRRVTTTGGVASEQMDYSGSLVLRGGLVDFVSTGQGRLKPSYGTSDARDVLGYRHEYALRDHLGSIRVRFDTPERVRGGLGHSVTVVQYDEYYPYGLRLAERAYVLGEADDELFHGKRLDEGHGLDWHHYGWRYYDAEIGRWVMVDPADEFYTAYSYVGADPVNLLDPDGAQVIEGEARQVSEGIGCINGGGCWIVGEQINSYQDALYREWIWDSALAEARNDVGLIDKIGAWLFDIPMEALVVEMAIEILTQRGQLPEPGNNNAQILNDFRAGDGVGFSGVFDLSTNSFRLLRSAVPTNGELPDGWVPRNGGHFGVMMKLLDEVPGVDDGSLAGFALQYVDSGADVMKISFRSGTINLGRHGNVDLPENMRPQIIYILERVTGKRIIE